MVSRRGGYVTLASTQSAANTDAAAHPTVAYSETRIEHTTTSESQITDVV